MTKQDKQWYHKSFYSYSSSEGTVGTMLAEFLNNNGVTEFSILFSSETSLIIVYRGDGNE